MSDLDLGAEIENDIKNEGAQHGFTLYDFDLSSIQVTVGAPVFGPLRTDSLQPVEAARRNYQNCTRQSRQERVQLTHRSSSSYRVKLSGNLRLTRGMSSAIRATALVTLASNFSAQLDLTAEVEKSGSREEAMAIDENTTIAPCTNLKVAILESKAVFRVDFRIPVLVVGSLSCYLDVAWRADPKVDWSYSRQFEITGTAEVEGVQLDKTWDEYRANCPAGTSCARLAALTDEEFWSHAHPGTVSETPGEERPRVHNCGDSFRITAAGFGETRKAAEQNALASAERGAEHMCPDGCAGVRIDWVNVQFDGDEPRVFCTGTAIYQCSERH